jgi:hypothetical protein
MRLMRTAAWLAPCAIVLVLQTQSQAGDAAGRVDFNRAVRPILSESCYQCHGPDQNKRKADLRLDLREGLFRSADGTTIVVPRKPDESELIARISSNDPEVRMPPPKHGSRLKPEQIDLLKRWVAEGAEWKGHWAYDPPARMAAPQSKGDHRWVAGEIDRFVQAEIVAHGLEPSPEVDRRTLIRRLSFDLTGLPPTPEEVEQFENDKSCGAYERLVDRLLASPHYGERMAIFWLDLVRFADTTGYHSDNHVDIWLFRDYVIRSFNADKPFDRFTIEQLAGDLAESPTEETRIASGYNRLLLTTQEGGAQAKEYMAKYSADRVRNVSTVWLGSTMGCCECHDHKYDPFKTREFYSMAAFFADIKETVIGVQEPTQFPTAEQAREQKNLTEEIAPLKANKKASDVEKRKLAELERRLVELRNRIPTTLVSSKVEPRVMRVLPRGNWLNETGEVVLPAVPAALPGLPPKKDRATRLDLARWLVSGQNPLPARVMVNRLWKLFFGQGLVATMDDFGSQGAPASHPELLDNLARDFMDTGWDVKAMVRKMVMSQTYRQGSSVSEEKRLRDPANRWLARQSRFRLDAEMVRDNALKLSGLLCDRIGGPSVKPYQPPGYWIFLNFPKRDWLEDKGSARYRRGLYTYWQRMFLHPSLLAFDASTREECVVERPRSNTPIQALVLLNDPWYVESARALAARMIREGGADPKARIARGFQLAVSRPPRGRESQVLMTLLEHHYNEYRADPSAAAAVLAVGPAPAPAEIDPVELAAWTSVARVLLNLQETLSRS